MTRKTEEKNERVLERGRAEEEEGIDRGNAARKREGSERLPRNEANRRGGRGSRKGVEQ